MKPGDVYWYNDCYGSRGAVSHSNDQVLLAPVFREGQVCAFVMSWAHFADIGGLHPGSISPDATDIFQEGIIVPPTKLIDAGVTNEAALAIFHRNSRYPDQSIGDMSALMASVELGATRIGEIFDRFGVAIVADALAQLLARTRRLVRKRLAETFDYGTHRFTDAIDGDGHGNGPFKMRFALTREKTARRRGPLHLRRDRERRPGARPGEPGDESRRARHGARAVLSRRRPGAGVQCRRAAGARRGAAARGLDRAAALSRAARHARPHRDARAGDAERTRQRRPAASAPAAHAAYVISLMRGTFTDEAGESKGFLLADGIGVGYGARAFADGIDAVYFVAQENYPIEFLELGYPVRLRNYGIVGRLRAAPAAFAAAAALSANTRSSPIRRCWRSASTACYTRHGGSPAACRAAWAASS